MIESDGKRELPFRLEKPPSLTDDFKRIDSVIPEFHDVDALCISPTTSVQEAFRVMQQHKCSCLPVTEKKVVIGIFSYQSFARHLMKLQFDEIKLKTLPVWEFIETPDYLQTTDEIRKLIAIFEKEEVVLIGRARLLQAILSPIDAARFLHQISYPFILLGEIELALRKLIMICVKPEQLEECIQRSVHKKNLPSTLEEMTYFDYINILSEPENWKYFENVFGSDQEGYRVFLKNRLDQIKKIRNTVFHFKEALTDEEIQDLIAHREWFLMKARSVEVLSEGR